MYELSHEKRIEVLQQIVEGSSQRTTSRVTRAHRDTIARFLFAVGSGCQRVHDKLVRRVCTSVLECDEHWTFVGAKQKHLEEHHPPEFGDEYTFVGLARDSRLVVSFKTGKRDGDTTLEFIKDLRSRIVGKPMISSDGFEPYISAIEEVFGCNVNYGQVVKQYSGSTYTGSIKRIIIGNMDPREISTSLVERSNLTIRMNQRRFTRKCNAYSKKLENLRAAVALHYMHYNFCRIHETLRCTPAMEAGLTDTPWSLSQLMLAALAREIVVQTNAPPPAPRHPPVKVYGGLRLIQGGRR